MLKANLIISLRSLKKHLVYTWVNILGLSIALCCVFLTYLYTHHEWTFDQSYPESQKIYRLVLEGFRGEGSRTSALPYIHSQGFDDRLPAVEELSRNLFSYNGELVRAKNSFEQAFKEEKLIHAEASFLSIFKPKMIQGDIVFFDEPWKVLLSEKAAKKYFVDEKAVGETMIIGSAEYEVIGVYENFASNSSLRPDFLISMKSLQSNPSEADLFVKSGYFLFQTYLKIPESADLTQLVQDMTADARSRGVLNEVGGHFKLDPLENYHFQTEDYISTLSPKADEKLIVWLMAISVGLLLVAIANFGNISLAIALSKTKEIAVRKIIGARKSQIVKRSLFESLLLSFIAFLVSLILLELSLPVFSNFVDRELATESSGLLTYLVLFSIAIGVGLLAGLYPAVLISNFKIMSLFKTESRENRSGFSFKNLLLSFQFVITFVLLALTLFMNRQINHLLSKDPGFDFENVVIFTPLWFMEQDASKVAAFKEQLLAMPEVQDIAISDISPLTILRENDLSRTQLEEDRARNLSMLIGGVDCHFFDFYNIDTKLTSDITDQFCESSLITVLNQRARDGFEVNTTGKSFVQYYQGSFVYPVIQEGSVDNIHFTSTKEPFLPMAFLPMAISNGRTKFNIRLREGADQGAFIAMLNKTWWEIKPYEPFDLKVLEEEHKRVYSSELKLKTMAGALSLAVCFIAFAGVFALSIFYGKQKLKEVGIRKVLGASFRHLFFLQGKTFLVILLISCVAAVPVVQLLANDWMQQFASRVEQSNWIYLFTAITLVICTVLSAGWYSAKVARVNPADIIRDN